MLRKVPNLRQGQSRKKHQRIDSGSFTALRWRLRLAAVAILSCGLLTLAGCTFGSPDHEPETTRSTSSPAQPDTNVAVTCAIVSVVFSTMQHAVTGRAQGTLTVGEARAILDTIPSILRVALAAPGAKLNEQVSALLAAATKSPEANLQTPEAIQALSEINNACEDNATQVVIMGEGG